MKSLKFLAFGILLFVGVSNYAQVSVNVNIGHPAWGPVVTTEEYYYLPDVHSYYDIRQSQFIYLNNGTWIRFRELPPRYRSYNLHSGNVIVLHDYHGNSPYVYYKSHKVKYNKHNGPGLGKHKGKKGKH